MERFNRLLTTGVATSAAVAAGALPSAAAAECTPAQQEHFLERAADDPFTYFKTLVLDSSVPNVAVEVTDTQDPGTLMVNPFVIEYGGRIVSYAARSDEGGKSHIEMLAANRAKVQAYIGHRAIAVRHPRALVKERMVHAVPDLGTSPPAFTDGREAYAFEP